MRFSSLFAGAAAGAILIAVLAWVLTPRLMLTEYRSPFGVEETVERVKHNAIAEGWVVASTTALNASVEKNGGGKLPPIKLVNLCQAQHAFDILREDDSKILSVMMPCTISVYQKADGHTYVGIMNASLLGKMFGGTVARVMGGDVAEQQHRIISFVEG